MIILYSSILFLLGFFIPYILGVNFFALFINYSTPLKDLFISLQLPIFSTDSYFGFTSIVKSLEGLSTTISPNIVKFFDDYLHTNPVFLFARFGINSVTSLANLSTGNVDFFSWLISFLQALLFPFIIMGYTVILFGDLLMIIWGIVQWTFSLFTGVYNMPLSDLQPYSNASNVDWRTIWDYTFGIFIYS